MAIDSTARHEAVFQAEGVDPAIARVRGFSASEGLSRSYVIDVSVEILGIDLEPKDWLLRQAALVIAQASDGEVLRRYSGYVTKVGERATRRADRQRVSVTLESPLALLRLTHDYRIFQEQTTQDIAGALLAEVGIDAGKIDWRLSGSYPKREVCTQFGETSFAFLSRILEEDGIFFFFELEDGGPRLVFGDSSGAFAATTPSDTIPFMADTGLVSHEAIGRISEVERVRPAKVTLRDHDFKRPKLDLEAMAEATAPLGREHYDYPGRYVEPSEGKRRAGLRLEAMTADATGATGSSTASSLTPGHTFTLSGAIDPALDQEWVVRDLESTWEDVAGGSSVLKNRFHLLPKSVPFRPAVRTPRAIVPGPQVAKVTGPPGEDIHCDEFGRIKVLFPWDRRNGNDDKSSCWVRVTQLHTSGSVAIPRIGWEVLVDFEDGDPDKPIVLGRVYNGRYGPPYPLPGGKTISSLQSLSSPGGGGQNEIRMDDGGGAESVHMRAQKDMNLVTANNKTQKVTSSESLNVGANHALDVGAAQKVTIGASSQIDVGAAQTWAVGASRTKTISAAEKISVKGSRSLTIGGSHTTMTPMSVSTGTKGSLSETVGGSCIEAAALGVSMACAGAVSINVGAAKIEAVASGKTDLTIGARASTVGGAFISCSGADVGFAVGGAKATTVGGLWGAAAGGDVEFSSGASLNITVGGAVAFNAAKIVFKVGGSNVTIASGGVVITTSEIKLTATGPQPELAPLVEDK